VRFILLQAELTVNKMEHTDMAYWITEGWKIGILRYVLMYVHLCTPMRVHVFMRVSVCTCARVHIHMYVCMYVCMHVYLPTYLPIQEAQNKTKYSDTITSKLKPASECRHAHPLHLS
jgi:hypothetical protein